jgi:hypothetical protein
MNKMAMSKINPDDARDWLTSLQQVGEGWYLGVATAVRAGAPKALGMTNREFAQQIGQKLIDPRDAIVELAETLRYRGKPNIQGIAHVLGVGQERVSMVLAEAGLIELAYESRPTGWDERPTAPRSSRAQVPIEEETARAESADELQAKADKLAEQLRAAKANAKGAAANHADEIDELRGQIKKLQRERTGALRKAREEAEAALTEQERARIRKEAEAAEADLHEEFISTLAPMLVRHIVMGLEGAGEDLRTLVTEGGGMTKAQLKEIEAQHAAFCEDLNIARMSERV